MAKVGDDLVHARGVVGDTFCGTCGYNLRTRPLLGRCPECGSGYDARPHHPCGVFRPQDIRIPALPLAWGVLCLALGGPLLYLAVDRRVTLAYIPAVPLLLLGLAYLWNAGKGLARYLRYRALVRHIERQAGDEDS